MVSLSFVVCFVTHIVTIFSLRDTNHRQLQEFPSCGDCWCSHTNQSAPNGYPGGCPIWQPTQMWPNATIDGYKNQHPKFLNTLNCNPYTDPGCQTTPPQKYVNLSTAVCGFLYENTVGISNCADYTYTMVTYPTVEDLIAAGAQLTHYGTTHVYHKNLNSFIVILRIDNSTS